MCFFVKELDSYATWVSPVFGVDAVWFEGHGEGVGGEDIAEGGDDVDGEGIGDGEGGGDASALGAGAGGVEVDWVEGAVVFYGFAGGLGLGGAGWWWAEEGWVWLVGGAGGG